MGRELLAARVLDFFVLAVVVLVGCFVLVDLRLRIAVTLAARLSSAAGISGLAMPLGVGSRHERRHLGHFTFCPAKRSGALRRLLHSGQATLILKNRTFLVGHGRSSVGQKLGELRRLFLRPPSS